MICRTPLLVLCTFEHRRNCWIVVWRLDLVLAIALATGVQLVEAPQVHRLVEERSNVWIESLPILWTKQHVSLAAPCLLRRLFEGGDKAHRVFEVVLLTLQLQASAHGVAGRSVPEAS